MKNTQIPLLWLKGCAFILWMLFPIFNAHSSSLKALSVHVSDSKISLADMALSGTEDTARPASATVMNFWPRAIAQPAQSILTWQTGYEKKIVYFDVQRSRDGIHWVSIGMIYTYPNCNTLNVYKFTDPMPEAINYYRLGQMDIYQKMSYTNISRAINFSFPKEYSIKLFPNPSAGSVNIETNKPTTYYIYNTVGDLITTGQFNNHVQLNDLSTGMYLVKIMVDNDTETFKLLVN